MRTHFFWSVWAWLVLSLHVPSARAEADDAPTTGLGIEAQPAWLNPNRPERAGDETWYGWQTLTTDGVALTGLLGAGLFGNGAGYGIAALSLGGYVLLAPIVHAVHTNWGAAVGSLALRLLPIASATAIYACSSEFYERDEGCEAAVGTITMLSFVLPIVLDSTLFAYEDAVEQRAPPLWVAAWLDRSGGGITLGDAF